MASQIIIPSKSQVLGLYRGLIKYARQIQDYNFRAYALRRSRVGFEKNKNVEGDELAHIFSKGLQQLETVRRQALIGQLYPHELSVMEKIHSAK
mmetsp:Transcript_8509/g.11154  ORF Transcript_8509/g.11154 Transcript_8509/m.11154 type:complete len:94 (-) Transcript_8509:146-427(-)